MSAYWVKTGSDQPTVRTTRLTQLGHETSAQTKALLRRTGNSNFKLLVHRLSRHAIMYKGDLRTSSTAVLDRPMSASRWSSSSRSCLHWYRRSHPRAIPASHASGIFQDHLRSGSDGDAASRVLVELQIVLPHDMFHLRNGAKQRLAAGAHRAVVTGPSAFCITPTFGAQATVRTGVSAFERTLEGCSSA
jgi:hypothetical protein